MIYISPPFGTWIQPRTALPVLGSYTLLPRPGRLGQIIKTVRKVPGGWVNAIGLRNPGIQSLKYRPGIVFSLAGINDGDWDRLHDELLEKNWPAYLIELNLSCPNVAEYGHPSINTLRKFTLLKNATVSVKLPPNAREIRALGELSLEAGIRLIHLSNTIPSPRGGISGDLLRMVNLLLVERFSAVFSQAQIIAGGGICSTDHARWYLDVGATHLSLATVFFNLVRGLRVYKAASKLMEHNEEKRDV